MAGTSVMWFRRDLRLADNPALAARCPARGRRRRVVALFCLDDRLCPARRAPPRWPSSPAASGRSTSDRRAASWSAPGRPADGRPGARRGGRRRRGVRRRGLRALRPRPRRRGRRGPAPRRRRRSNGSASPYAVPPGRGRATGSGDALQGVHALLPGVARPRLARPDRGHRRPSPGPTACGGDGIPDGPHADADAARAGRGRRHAAARRFWDTRLDDYADARDRPADDATTRLSPYLKWGCIHPRQLLARLGRGDGPRPVPHRAGLAGVLRRRPVPPPRVRPHGARRPPCGPWQVDRGRRRRRGSTAWAEGRTGYPIVDAGMRQLLARGLDAQPGAHDRGQLPGEGPAPRLARGARWFMDHLVDGDLASNHHGWQWVAGTGTDAAPYFRVFNPVSQGERFDPDGDLRPALGARAGGSWPTRRSTARGTAPAGRRPATPRRSSTTPRSARRRCAATTPSAPRPTDRWLGELSWHSVGSSAT